MKSCFTVCRCDSGYCENNCPEPEEIKKKERWIKNKTLGGEKLLRLNCKECHELIENYANPERLALRAIKNGIKLASSRINYYIVTYYKLDNKIVKVTHYSFGPSNSAYEGCYVDTKEEIKKMLDKAENTGDINLYYLAESLEKSLNKGG